MQSYILSTDADDPYGQDPEGGPWLDGQRRTPGLPVTDATTRLWVFQAGTIDH